MLLSVHPIRRPVSFGIDPQNAPPSGMRMPLFYRLTVLRHQLAERLTHRGNAQRTTPSTSTGGQSIFQRILEAITPDLSL